MDAQTQHTHTHEEHDMSTRIYLTCESHDPPLRAEEESGQTLVALPRVRAEIADRARIARIETEDLPYGLRATEVSARFLAQHPHCEIGIVDEYDRKHSIEREPDWFFKPAVRAHHKDDDRTRGAKRIWSPDGREYYTWSTPSLRNVPWIDLVDVEPLDIIEDVK